MNRIIRKIAISFGFVLVFYLWFQALYCVMVEHNIFPFKSFRDFLPHLIRNLSLFYLFFICDYLIIFKIRLFRNAFGKRLVKDFILSNVACIILDLLYIYVTYFFTGVKPFVDWGATILFNMTMVVIIETYRYLHSYKRSLKEIEIKNTRMLQYQYDALKAQVNPHFLFNSLTILYSLIEIDKEKSLQFTMALSQTYRYILSHQDTSEVRLQDEISFLKSFTNVLVIRYNESFTVEIHGEENIGEHTVIPYGLQLLLENVIKHNVINEQNPMCVKVEIDDIGVTMRNPIRLRQTLNSSKIGLTYIKKMYAVYGKKFEYDDNNEIFTAKIPYLK